MSKAIVVIKLSSSEEVIGRVHDEDDDTITLEHSHIVAVNPNTGEVGLLPFMVLPRDADVVIEKRHIMATATKIPLETEKKFQSQISGIVI